MKGKKRLYIDPQVETIGLDRPISWYTASYRTDWSYGAELQLPLPRLIGLHLVPER